MLLQHAIDVVEGHQPGPLLSQLGDVLPPIPQRGEVDFIYGGKTNLIHKQIVINLLL